MGALRRSRRDQGMGASVCDTSGTSETAREGDEVRIDRWLALAALVYVANLAGWLAWAIHKALG